MSDRTAVKPLIVGIAGGSGSGKTTIVNKILESLDHKGAAVIQHDSYYKDRSHLPYEERDKVNYDHPDALETDLLIQHLTDLREGKNVAVPVYDFTTHTRKKDVRVIFPQFIVIVDGILIHVERKLRELMDIKIFVDTEDDARLARRIKRDMSERGRTLESIMEQYLETVRPMHIKFVESSKRYADLIVSGEDHTAADRILSIIQSRIDVSC